MNDAVDDKPQAQLPGHPDQQIYGSWRAAEGVDPYL